MIRCNFEVVSVAIESVTIRDLNNGRMSVTNDAENVVAELRRAEILIPGRRLFYFDSQGHEDEILWQEDGSVRFAFGGD